MPPMKTIAPWNSDKAFTPANTLLLVFSAVVAIVCQVLAFKYAQSESHAPNDQGLAGTHAENLISKAALASK